MFMSTCFQQSVKRVVILSCNLRCYRTATATTIPCFTKAKMSGASSSQEKPSLTTPDKEDVNRGKCLFCKIADEQSQDLTRLVYKDEEIVAFPDIRPAAKYHFLVVPREHIKNAKLLNASHIRLVDRLVEVGHKVVNDQMIADGSADGKDIKVDEIPKHLGYHWPPFNTIGHLHLHVIAPANQMSIISRTIFRPNSWWFVTPEYIKERLSKDVILPCGSQSTNAKSDDSPKC